jgi:hypothetical protein
MFLVMQVWKEHRGGREKRDYVIIGLTDGIYGAVLTLYSLPPPTLSGCYSNF